jgi:hypothetical protein
MRRLLIIFSGLTMLAFAVLFVGAGQTDRYFAWTINPPATAAFLGAAYAGGCALVVLGLRRGTWSTLRIPFVTILVFTLVTLAATVLHLDKFHFARSGLALFAAWFWLAIYVFVPLAMIILLVRQIRNAVPDPGPRLPIPRPLVAALLTQGGILLAVGVALFVAPATQAVLWPWMLTPLTARTVAAWLLAFGLGGLLAVREGDLARLDVSATAYALLAGLEIVVLIRYAEVVRWTAPATAVYLGLFVLIMVCGVYALRRIYRASAAEVPYSPG